jgi:hypothetical protein
MRPLELSKASRRAFEALAADLRRIFGDRLVALVAHGPATSLAFVTTIGADDLDACAMLVMPWHREGLEPPLILTPDEFRRSLDAFPLEYAAILDEHAIIVGHDPFAGVTIHDEDIRRACEIQARGLLIHLRQGWLDAAGHADDLAALIGRSAAPLRHLLIHVAHLEDARVDSLDEIVAFANGRLGLPGDLVKSVLSLETAPDGARQLVRRLPEYLAAAEHLWTFVDAWRAR